MSPQLQLDQRIAQIVGRDTAAQIMEMIEGDLRGRCRDADCVRFRTHPRLAFHLWRHDSVPPLTRSLLGWRCFACGRLSWHRVHRTSKQQAS